jgi:hypothetical protein
MSIVLEAHISSRPEPLIVGSAPMCQIPGPGIVLSEGAVIEIIWRTVCYGKKPVVVGSTGAIL